MATRIRTFREDHTNSVVVVGTGAKERVLGSVRPLGQAFQCLNAKGEPVALKSLESQAIAWFKYNS
jgi:hypothetical protein